MFPLLSTKFHLSPSSDAKPKARLLIVRTLATWNVNSPKVLRMSLKPNGIWLKVKETQIFFSYKMDLQYPTMTKDERNIQL